MIRASARTNSRLRDLPSLMRIDVTDMTVIRDRIDTRFRENETQLFASEGASGGVRWAPLTAKYAEKKKREFPGRKILSRKGELRRSLTTRGGAHIATYSLSPAVVEVGTRDPKAKFHAEGTSRMVRRDPIQHTEMQKRSYLSIVKEYLVNVKLARVIRVLSA